MTEFMLCKCIPTGTNVPPSGLTGTVLTAPWEQWFDLESEGKLASVNNEDWLKCEIIDIYLNPKLAAGPGPLIQAEGCTQIGLIGLK